MNEAEMQAIADSTLLEQCKKALETTEPISLWQQKQMDVQGQPQQRRQQQAEEEELCAPKAAPPPYPIGTSLLSPLEAEDSGTAPPEENDEYNFASHFLNYLM